MGLTEITGDQVRDVDEFRIGLLADRPTSPLAGWIYCASDFKKFFVCFVDGSWVHVNPVDITGASDGDYFKFDGVTGFLTPTPSVTGFLVGLDASKPANPDIGQVYLATDTQIVYYCFVEDEWTPTYLPQEKLTEFEYDINGDVNPVGIESIFVEDEVGDLMPSLDGEQDNIFEIVGGEITPKI
jgi:hypothetical protein